MNAIRFPWFRSGYVAAAICLASGASCMPPATGLMRAFMTVGTDVQLPLERIATVSRESAQVTDPLQRLHTSASEAADAH
ncbi:hypothetical protein R75465_05638 [Paraburkholderia aspalathi]|uniref:hypothetical protein n=1 Tax=Paraburkholderia aspalathi TaxID=1324617 RepID=UPI001AFE6053|nr:hypothetical protein [Paraburkholderia aspalathi]CAE6816668.1 hypothetical protein R75465_05638 [Paraburkholderia aspalathi]